MKKWMVLGLAAMMALSMTSALAVPSKTTASVTKVQTVTTASGNASEVKLEVVTEPDPVVEEVVAEIFTTVVTDSKPVTEVFTPAVATSILATLKVDDNTEVAPEALQINEIVPVKVAAYTPAAGAVTTTYSFATVYRPTQKVAAVVGVTTNRRDANGKLIVEWLTVDAIVLEDGSVQVVYPEECMLKMSEASSVALAIVNAD